MLIDSIPYIIWGAIIYGFCYGFHPKCC